MPAKKITPEVRATRLIRGAMAESDYNLEKLAKRLNKSTSTISSWVRNPYNLKVCDLMLLCKVIRLDPVKILEVQ